MKLSYQIFLQLLLPLLANVDVDITVLLQHGLALGEHHHGADGEVFKLVLAEESLGPEDEEDPESPDDWSQRRLQVPGVTAVKSVTDEVGSGRALSKHSGIE